MPTTTVLQFGARPGQRRPLPEPVAAPSRIRAEIKKITTQPGKFEIVLSADDVDTDVLSVIMELQQSGAVYVHFSESSDEGGA